jgi:negative regulator of replication initiation
MTFTMTHGHRPADILRRMLSLVGTTQAPKQTMHDPTHGGCFATGQKQHNQAGPSCSGVHILRVIALEGFSDFAS